MPTRILIVIPVPSSYLSGLLRAATYLGIKTSVFNSRGHTLLEKVIIGITGRTKLPEKLLNRRLVQMNKIFKPDILLAMKGELIDAQTLNEIGRTGTKTANWFPDYVNSFDLALKLSSYYNFLFHFDPLAASQLEKRGGNNTYYLPFAADILPTDKKPQRIKKQYRITFIGNHDSYRESYLKSVSDLGLNIWGDRSWSSSSLATNYRGPLPIPEVHNILARSEIGLNIQHQYPCYGAVLRVFEVTSTGTLLLSESVKYLNKLFTIGKELDVFGSNKSLREKVIYYLGHAKERQNMAMLGYLATKTRHTYVHRLIEIIDQIT